jgi:hypothetical protein
VSIKVIGKQAKLEKNSRCENGRCETGRYRSLFFLALDR